MLRPVSTGHSNDESTVGISAGYLFKIIGKSPIFRLGKSVDDLKVLNPTAGESVGSVGLRGEIGYESTSLFSFLKLNPWL